MTELDALIDGEMVKIAFNGKYLSDALGVLQQSQVALELTTTSSLGVIRPVGRLRKLLVVLAKYIIE